MLSFASTVLCVLLLLPSAHGQAGPATTEALAGASRLQDKRLSGMRLVDVPGRPPVLSSPPIVSMPARPPVFMAAQTPPTTMTPTPATRNASPTSTQLFTMTLTERATNVTGRSNVVVISGGLIPPVSSVLLSASSTRP